LSRSYGETKLKSDLASPGIVNTPSGPGYRLSGKVITKGGGFIQVRLDWPDGPFDASDYRGVEVVVDAPAGGKYFVFLRTRDNFFVGPVDEVVHRLPDPGYREGVELAGAGEGGADGIEGYLVIGPEGTLVAESLVADDAPKQLGIGYREVDSFPKGILQRKDRDLHGV